MAGWQRQAQSSELADGFIAFAEQNHRQSEFAAATRNRTKTFFMPVAQGPAFFYGAMFCKLENLFLKKGTYLSFHCLLLDSKIV